METNDQKNFDYEKIGLKCGLEIHQQLDTSKLFCGCQSILRQDNSDFEIRRKLHAVAGESGEVDVAARHEAEQEKEFIYQGYNDTNCLVELDEEPPHEINKDALKTAIQISFLLNCVIIPITQIMRKTVVNGSNTGGFQRTLLIASNGWVETNYGRVGIEGVLLEEDSARLVSKSENGKEIVYRLDRLGIPLVEIATSPDIKSAEQAKEVALHIGALLRRCRVKRGIGTIRQDINISIKGSNRVELKGFQDQKIMALAVNNEITRQLSFLNKGEKNSSEVRNVLPDGKSEFLRPMPGPARMYPETDLPLLKISREFIDEAKKEIQESEKNINFGLKSRGLNNDMVNLLLKEKTLEDFKELLKIRDDPQLIVKMLFIFPKEIASKEKISLLKVKKLLNKDSLAIILEGINDGKIKEDQAKQVISRVLKGESIINSMKFEKQDIREIEEQIMNIIKEKPGLSANAYMGLAMKEFSGKISGKEAIEIIKKYLK